MGQLSFYSADALPRALSDIEGLLCGPGRLVLFGRGTTARFGIVLGPVPPEPDEPGLDEVEGAEEPAPVTPPRTAASRPAPVVDGPDLEDLAHLDLDPEEVDAFLERRRHTAREDAVADVEPVPPPTPSPSPQTLPPSHTDDRTTRWRVHAVRCALRSRGLDVERGRAPDGRPELASSFRADLTALARCWTGPGEVKELPPGFVLDGPRLRLWVLAAGRRAGRAYLLGLDPDAPHLHERLLTASRDAGLGATLAGDARDPVLRIVGARRQARLAELVGARPREVADDVWPG